MKKIFIPIALLLFFSNLVTAQKSQSQEGHYNISKFRQLHQELPTANSQHTASGAPGYEYTQQQVDYKMNIVLDDDNQRIYGEETITYHNNSKDNLEYLWLQLDQNKRASDSKSLDVRTSEVTKLFTPVAFSKKFLDKPFDGGFKIEYVKNDSKSACRFC